MEVLYCTLPPPPRLFNPPQTPYYFPCPPQALQPSTPTPYHFPSPPLALPSSSTPNSYHFACPPLAPPPSPPNRVIHWTPPPRGCLKLNTDGSCVNGRGSYGGVLRDEFGVWFSGYMGRIPGSSTTSVVAEIWGVYQGLLWIETLGLHNVVVETDCRSVVDLFKTSKVNGNHSHKGMIEHGRAIMSQCGCVIAHTFRECNMCADQLAKLGGRQRMEVCYLDLVPACAIPFLMADANGVGFERPSRRRSYR